VLVLNEPFERLGGDDTPRTSVVGGSALDVYEVLADETV
jgi:hypothetical protein